MIRVAIAAALLLGARLAAGDDRPGATAERPDLGPPAPQAIDGDQRWPRRLTGTVTSRGEETGAVSIEVPGHGELRLRLPPSEMSKFKEGDRVEIVVDLPATQESDADAAGTGSAATDDGVPSDAARPRPPAAETNGRGIAGDGPER